MATQLLTPIEVSHNDKRNYRHITLPNKLECLLVQDSETEKSCACCDVHVGSMADPKEAPGLAHFLEHMLFLGTEAYPTENAYSSFLNSHGGHSNAFTSQENTVYYFDIQNPAFEEALNMFASFFTCPLFTESATLREMNAVDSENQKNLQSDSWRHFQLMKALARDGHPFQFFSTGNLDTLQKLPESLGLNTRDMVIEFYKKHYSANVMKLVVYGKESLDTLQGWVEAKFSSVSNKDLAPLTYPDDVYHAEQLSKILEVEPVRDVKSVDIYFPMPAVEHLYLTKPLRYLSHLIGHESGGSVLSALKAKGWANGLAAMNYHSYSFFSCLCASVELTDEGVAHTDDIISAVFAYIGMLIREGPKEWIAQEIKEMGDMNFRFIAKSEPSRYAIRLANNMQQCAPEHIVSGDQVVFQLDTQAAWDYVKYCTPENSLVIVKHKGFTGKTALKEQWYGTNYNLRSLDSDSQVVRWRDALEGKSEWEELLYLPKENPFVPTDFNIRATTTTATATTTAVTTTTATTAAAPTTTTAATTAAATAAATGAGNSSSSAEEEEEDESVLSMAQRVKKAMANTQPALVEQRSTHDEDAVVVEAGTLEESMVELTIAAAEGDEEAAAAAAAAAGEGAGEEGAVEEEEEEEEEAIEEGPVGKLPNPAGRLISTWFLQDSTWKLPKANVMITLDTIQASATPLGVAFTDTFASVLKEVLNEFSYYADCAGLHYDISLAKSGLELMFYGYHHKLPVLVSKALEEMHKLGSPDSACDADLFLRMKEKTLRSLYNYRFWQPYYLCLVGTVQCLEDPRWTNPEKYAALSAATLQDFQSFSAQLMRQMRAEVFVHGNTTDEEAKTLAASIVDQLQFLPLSPAQEPVRRVVRLEAGVEYLYRQHIRTFNPSEVNSAVENVYIVGESEGCSSGLGTVAVPVVAVAEDNDHDSAKKIANEALLELMAHLISEPAFDQLRTKEQLGYIVFTGVKKVGLVNGLHIIVQSSTKDPTYLDQRVEDFLVTFRDRLEQLSIEDLETNVKAVVEKLLEKPKNLNEESMRYWDEVKQGTYLFDRKPRLATHLLTVTLQDCVAFFDLYIRRGGSQRKKFSSQLFGAQTKYPAVLKTHAVDIGDAGKKSTTTATATAAAVTAVSSEVLSASAAVPVVVISDPSAFKRSMHLLPCKAFQPKVQSSSSSVPVVAAAK